MENKIMKKIKVELGNTPKGNILKNLNKTHFKITSN